MHMTRSRSRTQQTRFELVKGDVIQQVAQRKVAETIFASADIWASWMGLFLVQRYHKN